MITSMNIRGRPYNSPGARGIALLAGPTKQKHDAFRTKTTTNLP